MLFWYLLISRNATVPGRYLRFFPCGTGSPAARAIVVSKMVRATESRLGKD